MVPALHATFEFYGVSPLGRRNALLYAAPVDTKQTPRHCILDFFYHPSLFTICTSTLSKLVEGG
jgi:hypothetical protein